MPNAVASAAVQIPSNEIEPETARFWPAFAGELVRAPASPVTSSAVVAATTASILVSPHVYGYDAALLLPSFCLVLFETRATLPRLLAVFLCSPVPYLLNLAGFPWRLATSLCLIFFLLLLAGSRDAGFRLPWRRESSE